MALSYTTAKWVELTWWISWSQNTNLIKDWSFDFISVCFLMFDVALVNSFIVYMKLENKDLTLKEFKICIALKLIASFISQKLSCPNQVHQSLKIPPDTSPTFDNFLGNTKTMMYCMLPSRKTKQSICYVFIMWCSPLPSKRILQYHS